MITTRDIAERLQLSVSTVGRALADDRRISEQTKLRVRQAAVEMGYVGNRAARIMRGASSKVVGLVIPDVRNSFYATVAHELSTVVDAQGFQLILAETNDDRTVELRQLRELSASRVAGVTIVPTARPHRDAVGLLGNIPHVQLLRRIPSLAPHWFGVDDHEVLREATSHLLDQGHARVGYIGGSEELPTGAQRLQGFRDALREHRRPRGAGVVELAPPSSIDGAAAAVRRLLARPSAPTALVLGSVQHTVGVLEELFRAGVKVPDELSVVGFGDEPGFSWWGPGLTTMRLPMQDIAAACGLWFVRRLEGGSSSRQPYSSVSPGSLIVRGSTASPPATHKRPA
jgi:LacI family transcriptional regulator